MEDKRDMLIDLVKKIKDEISKIKDELVKNKKEVTEVKEIINNLKTLEKSLNPKQKWYKEKIESLDIILNQLQEIRFDIFLETVDDMFKVIGSNLMYGMKLKEKDGNKDIMLIEFEENNVGSIEILEEHKPDIKIGVTVYNNYEEFEIHEMLRIYSIISYINTKFNYKDV
ncbi:hypothetical protein [Ruminiclostridium papyrosolvens]|uniref:Uncharacterized protein n=1 Tax=Ruminiclostridium papyrosolvens C7 TaxID=1330534 RepID=U4QYH3_9FIRM|nr:hypothetical protein [Ruminiclostridium papyrosolvens]EPR08119.1 hypothetical protein L323_18540 [Ruminiclostridium papyrosolvens C7]